MNNGKKIAIIIAVCLILIGIVIGGVALAVNRFRFDSLRFWEGRSLGAGDLTHVTYNVNEPFQNIDLRGGSGDVELHRASDGRCRVECAECEGWTHVVEVRGDTLYVERQRKTNVNLILGMNERDVIELWLPETSYETLALGTTSGDIRLPAEFRFAAASVSSTSGDMELRAQVDGAYSVASTSGGVSVSGADCGVFTAAATSGGISVNDLRGSDVSAASTSGTLHLENVTASGWLKAESTSGDIHMDSVSCHALETESSSGEQYLTDVRAEDDFRLTSTSGDIELERCDAGGMQIHTSSGGVTGSLASEMIVYTETSSGSVRVPRGEKGGVCEIHTSSGDIDLSFAA